jgi:hypothetical protein
MQLKVFEWYEDEFQRIVYRRFKYLYSTEWKDHEIPQGVETTGKSFGDDEKAHERLEEDKQIAEERQGDPSIVVIISDHRVRRLQHLLSDLVRLLDEEPNMKLNRPVRRCKMAVDKRVLAAGTSETFQYQVPCDCHSVACNPKGEDFEYRARSCSK